MLNYFQKSQAVPEKRSVRKDLNVVGANESEEDEFRESKKQKLDKELGKGDDRAGINVKGMPTFIAGSEHEYENLSRSQPLSDSTFVATEASVECVFCHSFRVTEVITSLPIYSLSEHLEFELLNTLLSCIFTENSISNLISMWKI